MGIVYGIRVSSNSGCSTIMYLSNTARMLQEVLKSDYMEARKIIIALSVKCFQYRTSTVGGRKERGTPPNFLY